MENDMKFKRICPECKREIIHTNKYFCLYSINKLCMSCSRKGNKNGMCGKHHSDETKKKIKEKRKNQVFSKETREKLSKIFSKRILSEDWKKKLSMSNTGKKRSEETKRKIRERMSNPVHFDKCQKNAFKRKLYILPSGKIIKIQGYENLTIDYLFSIGIKENDVSFQTKEIPHIKYKFNEMCSTYYPDCYIKSNNTICETKSRYTWNTNLIKNISKINACLNSGYNYRLIIWDNRHKLIEDKTIQKYES